MIGQAHKNIIANIASDEIIGRAEQLAALLTHAGGQGAASGLVLRSAPGCGATTLLHAVFDKLFLEAGDIVPVYFALDRRHETSAAASRDFLEHFLANAVGFIRRDARLAAAPPDVHDITRAITPSEVQWAAPLLDRLQSAGGEASTAAFVRGCLSAPAKAAANGLRTFVMIDALHESIFLNDGEVFLREIRDALTASGVNFVLASRRRFDVGLSSTRHIDIGPLSFAQASLFAEATARSHGVAVNDQTRDLIAEQLQGNPAFIDQLFKSAKKRDASLESYRDVIRVYAEEIFSGSIGSFFDREIGSAVANTASRERLYDFLLPGQRSRQLPESVESWRQLCVLEGDEFHRAMNSLHTSEIIRLNSGTVEAESESFALSDYIECRYRKFHDRRPDALILGQLSADSLRRAPQLMARLYRQGSAMGLRRIIGAFDGQTLPAALFDYADFKENYKGLPPDEIRRKLSGTVKTIKVPQIINADFASGYYPPIRKISDDERCVAGIGFTNSEYTDDSQVIWIAAEIESKLEADKSFAEFWCDRLEMAALAIGYERFKIWLIAPEGFSPDALAVLSERSAFGSSRVQAELAAAMLAGDEPSNEAESSDDYEIIVPMGSDTELIAAHAVEEIARRHNFPPKAINQIKTALVEACINASEHSLSPDRKIYQRFSVNDEKITITVSNRGLRLVDKAAAAEPETGQGRRGWGLSLMKGLMDDVTVESVDDGTRISMTKYVRNTARNAA